MRLSIFIPLNYRHLLFVGTLGPIFVPEIKLLVGNGDRFECVNYSIIEIPNRRLYTVIGMLV